MTIDLRDLRHIFIKSLCFQLFKILKLLIFFFAKARLQLMEFIRSFEENSSRYDKGANTPRKLSVMGQKE